MKLGKIDWVYEGVLRKGTIILVLIYIRLSLHDGKIWSPHRVSFIAQKPFAEFDFFNLILTITPEHQKTSDGIRYTRSRRLKEWQSFLLSVSLFHLIKPIFGVKLMCAR